MNKSKSNIENAAGSKQPEGIRFNVEAEVTLAELSQWAPERIAQLFHGLAEIARALKGSA